MGRVIGIDYGSKRVGLAVTDPLQIIASPLDTIHSKDVISYLKNYIDSEEVECFVVGMPKNLDNKDTNATPLVQAFVNLLKKSFPAINIVLQDERFTSKMALDAMIQAGSTKKQRKEKGNIDKVSASIILQSYLEQK